MRVRQGSSSSSSSSYYDSSLASSFSSWDGEVDEEDDDVDEDDEDLNARRSPYWPRYCCVMGAHGYRLDTCRDVKDFYEDYWENHDHNGEGSSKSGECRAYKDACQGNDESALCKDAGLPDRLFRGQRICDGKRVVAKVVGLRSREFDITRMLSTLPLRDHPMNNTIPVLDILEVAEDDIAIIIMEEWSSQIVGVTPSNLACLLCAVKQCIEGVLFMHTNGIVHLDLHLCNILTDFCGHYVFIDFELGHRFERDHPPQIPFCRGSAIPPDAEDGALTDPFKIDIWALGTLIRQACQLTNYEVPELQQLTEPMLSYCANDRPCAEDVLKEFNRLMAHIPKTALDHQSVVV